MRHRGPHPEDQELFAEKHHEALRQATHDLSWLLSRGYAMPSALKLVGDRYNLRQRQRIAVRRCACSDEALASREERRIALEDIGGKSATNEARPHLLIDGFNLLTTIEAALAGGVILHGRDETYRDMASMHGTYRKVQETRSAIERVGESLARRGSPACRWLLDQPVSNSGRLKQQIETVAAEHGWSWTVDVVMNPDDDLIAAKEAIAVTADSAILDACERWLNLARIIVEEAVGEAWVVRLDG
jgi:hypothetical protein